MAQKPRFNTVDKIDDPRLTHVLVRTTGFGGYWGRGRDVAEAIKNAQYLGSQTKVYVCQCDAKGHCDPITGDLRCDARGALYEGKVMASRRDVLITGVFRAARL
jgi:hypothetical protein